MKKYYLLLIPILSIFIAFFLIVDNSEVKRTDENGDTPTGRIAYELARLADPATGKIPENIRARELALLETLPKRQNKNTKGDHIFKSIGPYNVGGRTRALAIDVIDTNTYLAGGVSGGLWRTTDEGQTWTRVTDANDHMAVSCIVQDIRFGRENIWYYGSGEGNGNSASKSYSAFYYGNGIKKSTDGGKTWKQLSATVPPVNEESEWSIIYNMAIDASRKDSDIVYAALRSGIMRSNDGGSTWSYTLKSPKSQFHNGRIYTNIQVSNTGIHYAVISNGVSTNKGIWRSTDGRNWTQIVASNFPSGHNRTLIEIYPNDENIIYFYSNTPGVGPKDQNLWKYEYLSGNGSGNGGSWTDLSNNLPKKDMNMFNGYCMTLKVKPDDSDVVFIGGNNLYRSTSGFADTTTTIWVGGYKVFGDTNYNTRTGRQHPDQQNMVFNPRNPESMLSSTDGGVHRTRDCDLEKMQWESLNNGYVTSQFYGIGIDHGTKGSNVVLGGLQDQGTYWTNTDDASVPWLSVRGSDGAYVAVEDGGDYYYISTQYANIHRYFLDSAGNRIHNKKVMPPSIGNGSGGGWQFVHPFTLDPVDNNIMYLPHENDIWRNTDLAAADSGDLSSWQIIESVTGEITAISASENIQGTVIVGTSGGDIFRIANAHTTGFKSAVEISKNISGKRGRTSCIAIDPQDEDRIIAVYSNYNVISLQYTQNGGATWQDIEGNLKGTPTSSLFPDDTDGPSMRWLEMVPTERGYRYFLGTSIGLFSTMELKGDSTEWVQEGSDLIGNVVVDMLDYRHVDHFLAVGTHGNGIYTTTVLPSTVGIDLPKESISESDWLIYPNPSHNKVSLRLNRTSDADQMNIKIYSSDGSLVKIIQNVSNQLLRNNFELDVNVLSPGTYYISIEEGSTRSVKAFVKI